MEVYTHKIFDGKYIVLMGGDIEKCYICDTTITTYKAPNLSSHGLVLAIDKDYTDAYPDEVIFDSRVYHLCSPNCRDLFELDLVRVSTNANVSSKSEFL